MELGLALEIWAASLAVAGAIGWIIGDRRGAADIAQLARDEEAETMREGLFTLTIPPLHPTAKSQSRITPPGEEGDLRISATRRTPMLAALGDEAPCVKGYERAEIFASMPAITELEEQVRAIRLSDPVWTQQAMSEQLAEFLGCADLGSLEVLSQYRKAIDELKRESEDEQASGTIHFPDASRDAPLLAQELPALFVTQR